LNLKTLQGEPEMSFGNNAAIAVRRPSFGKRGQQPAESAPGKPQQPPTDGAQDDVLAILEAASDLGDRETVAACRRIIEANKIGATVSPADTQLMLAYFR
jgi:hypothetical protein